MQDRGSDPKPLPVPGPSDVVQKLGRPEIRIEKVPISGGFKWQMTVDLSVGFFALLNAWIYWNLHAETSEAIKGVPSMNFKRLLAGLGGVVFLAIGTYLQTTDIITLHGVLQVVGAALVGWILPTPGSKGKTP